MYSTPMDPLSRVTLSPWEKWKKYRRVPFKLISRILILVLCVLQVSFFSSETTRYHSLATASLQATLFPSPDGPLVTRAGVRESVCSAVSAYSRLCNGTVGLWMYRAEDAQTYPEVRPESAPAVRFSGVLRSSPLRGGSVVRKEWSVSSEDECQGVLTDSFFAAADSLSMSMTIFGADVGGSVPLRMYRWDVKGHYSMGGGAGVVILTTSITPSVLNGHKVFQTVEAFAGLLMAACVLGFILAGRAVFKTVASAAELRHTSADAAERWGSMRLWDKARFFSTWHVATMAGDALLFVSALIFIIDVNSGSPSQTSLHTASLLLGIGTFITFTSTLHYLHHIDGFDPLIKTLRRALPRISSFIVSVAPIYIGFILAGVALFSRCAEMFRTPSVAAFRLIGVMNGDGVIDLFDQVTACPYPRLVTHIYSYGFMIVFIYTVANVYIFIVEDSFIVYKAKKAEMGEGGEVSGGAGGSRPPPTIYDKLLDHV